MLELFGIFFLVAAGGAFVLYLRTSYLTEGGRQGQTPCVAAAAVQVPMMTLLGLWLLDQARGGFGLAWWQWFAIWFVETVVVALVTSGTGNCADRKARRAAR